MSREKKPFSYHGLNDLIYLGKETDPDEGMVYGAVVAIKKDTAIRMKDKNKALAILHKRADEEILKQAKADSFEEDELVTALSSLHTATPNGVHLLVLVKYKVTGDPVGRTITNERLRHQLVWCWVNNKVQYERTPRS